VKRDQAVAALDLAARDTLGGCAFFLTSRASAIEPRSRMDYGEGVRH
jgi:hypothetical protein